MDKLESFKVCFKADCEKQRYGFCRIKSHHEKKVFEEYTVIENCANEDCKGHRTVYEK